jgi:hypothetical protein
LTSIWESGTTCSPCLPWPWLRCHLACVWSGASVSARNGFLPTQLEALGQLRVDTQPADLELYMRCIREVLL